jgi:hypothetical protein
MDEKLGMISDKEDPTARRMEIARRQAEALRFLQFG